MARRLLVRLEAEPGEDDRSDDGDADDVLAAAQRRTAELADAYLIDIDDDGAPTGRATIRETIRTRGPSVRSDLGFQAAQS